MNRSFGLYGIIAICVCALLLSGCDALDRLLNREESVEPSSWSSMESQPDSQQESAPASPSSSEAEDEGASTAESAPDAENEDTEPEENLEDNTMKQFVTPLTDANGESLTGTATFSIQFPEGWTVSDNLVYDLEGRQVAEILPSIPFEDESIFDKLAEQYPDSDPISVTVGGLSGMCFYHQTLSDDPAFAGRFNNELFYYLELEDELVCIKFIPALGMGVGTQREAFQADIKAIK